MRGSKRYRHWTGTGCRINEHSQVARRQERMIQDRAGEERGLRWSARDRWLDGVVMTAVLLIGAMRVVSMHVSSRRIDPMSIVLTEGGVECRRRTATNAGPEKLQRRCFHAIRLPLGSCPTPMEPGHRLVTWKIRLGSSKADDRSIQGGQKANHHGLFRKERALLRRQGPCSKTGPLRGFEGADPIGWHRWSAQLIPCGERVLRGSMPVLGYVAIACEP